MTTQTKRATATTRIGEIVLYHVPGEDRHVPALVTNIDSDGTVYVSPFYDAGHPAKEGDNGGEWRHIPA